MRTVAEQQKFMDDAMNCIMSRPIPVDNLSDESALIFLNIMQHNDFSSSILSELRKINDKLDDLRR